MTEGRTAEQTGTKGSSVGQASRAAVLAAVGFGALGVFQLALAAGAPLGRAAWGGGQTILPGGLRLASAGTVLFYVLAIVVVLRRGGVPMTRVPAGFARIGTWVLVGLLPLSGLANAASGSAWERFVMAPTALCLAALCLVLARGPDASSAAAR